MFQGVAQSTSKTFLAICVAVVAGIAAYLFLPTLGASVSVLIILIGVGALVAAWLWKKPIVRLLLFVGIFFVFGVLRGAVDAQRLVHPQGVAGLAGKSVSLRGVVAALPTLANKKASYLIEVEDVFANLNWQSRRGRVLLETVRFPEFHYGDRLTFTCTPTVTDANRGQLAALSASALCAVPQGIDLVGTNAADPVEGALVAVRSRFLERVNQLLPEPQAGLLAGLLVGERAGLTDELRLALSRSGTTHMIAISGFNVSIVTFWCFALLAAVLGRKRAFWGTLLLLLIFVGMVGAGASVVRAAVMGGVALLARYLGRDASAFRLLVIAAAVMLAVNPWLLRYDLGFMLSFSATAGLVVFGKTISRALIFLPPDFKLRETLAETLAATIATLPITLFAFGRFSLIAPVANLAVLLLVPWAMLVGFVATLAAAIPFLGSAMLVVAWILLASILGFVEVLGGLPWAAVAVPQNGLVIFGALIVVAALVVFAIRSTRREASSHHL